MITALGAAGCAAIMTVIAVLAAGWFRQPSDVDWVAVEAAGPREAS